jgi:hypothetical protein
MTDEILREHFGLSERALRRLRAMRDFPRKDIITNRTDSKAVDRFFDRRAGLEPHQHGGTPAAAVKERF